MCYDFKARVITQLKRAIHHKDKEAVSVLLERLEKLGVKDLYHTTGFDHPAVLIYTNDSPRNPVLARWGFIPKQTRDKEKSLQIWNRTLNARGEDMFETWSYKHSARSQRCLILIDGFFEHYHYKGKTYPYYIFRKDGEPMTLGGLWNEWQDKETGDKLTTFSIVTTKANELLSKIHNNPKMSGGPRMPLILSDDDAETWVSEVVENDEEMKKILSIIKPYADTELKAHTVRRLRSKGVDTNFPGISDEFLYDELNEKPGQGTLF